MSLVREHLTFHFVASIINPSARRLVREVVADILRGRPGGDMSSSATGSGKWTGFRIKWNDSSKPMYLESWSDISSLSTGSTTQTGTAEEGTEALCELVPFEGELEAVEVGTSVCGYLDALGKTLVRVVTAMEPTRLLAPFGNVTTSHGVCLVFCEVKRDKAGGVTHARAMLEFASEPLPRMLHALVTLDLEEELDVLHRSPKPVDSRPLEEAFGMRHRGSQKDVEEEVLPLITPDLASRALPSSPSTSPGILQRQL